MSYPVFTPMGPLAYALAAGNAVVYKPSEHTPAVDRWLVNRFAESLTPVVLECGGRDALVVDADADVPAAVEAALWGGLSNAGAQPPGE